MRPGGGRDGLGPRLGLGVGGPRFGVWVWVGGWGSGSVRRDLLGHDLRAGERGELDEVGREIVGDLVAGTVEHEEVALVPQPHAGVWHARRVPRLE